MKIQRILNNPHPFIFNRYSILLPSLLTFLVLVLLKPFEFATFPINQLIIWSALFAVIVGVTIFFCVSVVKRLFGKTIEENWKVKNEALLILFVLTVISLMIFLLLLNFNNQINWFELFSLVVVRTLALSFFPVLILVLYEQNHHQKLKRRQAEMLNQQLVKTKHANTPNISIAPSPEKIVLVAENKKIALQIDPRDLFFIKSEGNYVEVFYHRQHKEIQKELIRNSLKAIEEQLSGHDFFRCHNRFLINLRHVQKVEGNARNFELILENIEEKVPVSRSRSETLLQLFQQKTNLVNS